MVSIIKAKIEAPNIFPKPFKNNLDLFAQASKSFAFRKNKNIKYAWMTKLARSVHMEAFEVLILR